MDQSQYSQQQQRSPPAYGSPQSDELHLAGLSQPPPSQQQYNSQQHSQHPQHPQHQQLPSQHSQLQHHHHHHNYDSSQHTPSASLSSSATLGRSPHLSSPPNSQLQSPPTVPNVLQPAGGLAPRPVSLSSNPAPTLPTLPTLPSLTMQMSPQQADYVSRPPPPSTGGASHSHSYSMSRGSPAMGGGGGGFGDSAYHAYTPVTPSGSNQGGFMSPGGGTQRMPNAPLGLADIRPRADSGISDGGPGTLAYELAHPQPTTSNYLAPWTAYAFDWCKWAPHANSAGKLALASYLEDGHNFIHIIDSQVVPTPQEAYVPGSSKWSLDFTKVAEATHSYPVTRLLWEPQSSQKQDTDLLATSGDHLRLWSLPSDPAKAPSPQTNSITARDRNSRPVTKLTPLALLSNSKTPDHTAPLTSLDWNTVSPSLIITSSIDTTCTIWDIPSLTAKTQLIAHDKEVYDVRFCANSMDVFVSCGQDGSVRMFDLRSLEHSTIIYEPNHKDDRGRMSPTLAQQTMSTPLPLLRLSTSPHDTNLLATFAMDSNVVRLLDVRQPGQALFELRGHGGAINCIEWSPTRRGLLASGGDDSQVLIWDLLNQNTQVVNGSGQAEPHRNPVASWQCDYEVNNLAWVPRLSGADHGDWLGVGAGRGIWGVRLG